MKTKKTYEYADGKENEKVLLLLQKGRTGVQRVIFGRMLIIFLMVGLQVAALVVGALYLSKYLLYYLAAYWILSLLLVVYIVNRRDNTAFQMGWIIPIMLLPIFGSLLYLFIRIQPAGRLIGKRQYQIRERTKEFAKQDPKVREELSAYPGAEALAQYAQTQGGYPTYRCGSAEYYATGEEFLEALIPELEQAEHFIFMEYFIVQEGYMWGRILKILEEKVKAGVEVRVMYDGMCMLDKLPYFYPKELRALGIRCKTFAPLRPAFSSRQNNRDHRKILVIDGRVAYTGGVNLADEYINRHERFGYWKDNAIRITGNAVSSFTLMFLQMWNINERVEDEYAKYLEIPQMWRDGWQEHKMVGGGGETDGYVMPYGDSPYDGENLAENVYLDILNRAERYVHIMTPYLVLSQELRNALCYAAKRGVEVMILMPHIPDKKTAFCLAKTYYEELIDAGVEIYEYTPGFLHAKTFTSDDCKAVVGSINMDFRSLYLHYECAVYLYRVPAVADIEADMQETKKKSQRITKEDCRKRKIGEKLFGALMRLVAPLM